MPGLADVARDLAAALALEARSALERSGLAATIAEHGRNLSRAIVAAALDLERRDGILVLRARLEERSHESGSPAQPAVVLELHVDGQRPIDPRHAHQARRPGSARGANAIVTTGSSGMERRSGRRTRRALRS
jgi:hypothetical protein